MMKQKGIKAYNINNGKFYVTKTNRREIKVRIENIR
jgi:hypothetical protein